MARGRSQKAVTDRRFTLAPAELQRRQLVFRPCETREELRDWLIAFLGVELPDCTVHPDSNSNPLDFIWFVYRLVLSGGSEDVSQVLGLSSRDSFKTFGAAVFEVLVLLHAGLSVVHLAAIEKQSLKAQEYVRKFLDQPGIREFADGEDNKRTRGIVRYEHLGNKLYNLTQAEFQSLSAEEQRDFRRVELKIEVAICTMTGVNSLHACVMVFDEVDIVPNPKAYTDAKLIPGSMGDQLPVTVMISTRKSKFGKVQQEVDEAHKTGLKILQWNIIDVARPCPATRHRPDLPRLPIFVNPKELQAIGQLEYDALRPEARGDFSAKEGYAGCLQNCRLFASCGGRLATEQASRAAMLKPIPDVQHKFRNVGDVEVAKAQLLCLKPSSEGLVYPRLDEDLHHMSSAQAYSRVTGEVGEMVDRMTPDALVKLLVSGYGGRLSSGMDFGYSHNFAICLSIIVGQYCIVLDGTEVAQLELEQQIELSKGRLLPYDPEVWADPAYPGSIKSFRRHKFRMRNWQKKPGSVMGGIQIVRSKARPALGEPELIFLADSPGSMLVYSKLAKYHFTQDAQGNWTDVPDDEDDDLCDAFRYMVMNEFPSSGGRIQAAPAEVEPERPPALTPQQEQEERMRGYFDQMMAQTGLTPTPSSTVRKGKFFMVS